MTRVPFFVGLAGGTASGKSTLAQKLVELSPAGMFSILLVDSYYRRQDHLSMTERAMTNYDHPDSLEFDLLIKHVNELKCGRPAEIPIYDYSRHTRSDLTNRLSPTPVIIIEGILSLYPEALRNLYQRTLFVDAPADVRLQRRMERDIRERGRSRESVLEQWKTTVQPMHERFCDPCRGYADEIINGLQFNDGTAERLIAEIKQLIERN